MKRTLQRIAVVVVLLVLAAPWLEAAKPASGTPLDTGNALYTSIVNAWGFLEGSGGTSVDSKASNTATLNHTSWSTDSAGDVALLATANFVNTVTLASTVNIASAGTWTIAYRTKTTSADANGMVNGDASGTEFVWMNGGSYLDHREGGDVTFAPPTVFTTEHDYVVTFKQTDSHSTRLYIDGVEASSSPNVAGAGTLIFDRLMCGYSSSSFSLIGTLSYFVVWNGRALTSTEAASLHSTPYQLWSAASSTPGCKNGLVLLGAGCDDTNAAMRIHAPFFARVVPSRGWVERQLQPLYRRAS